MILVRIHYSGMTIAKHKEALLQTVLPMQLTAIVIGLLPGVYYRRRRVGAGVSSPSHRFSSHQNRMPWHASSTLGVTHIVMYCSVWGAESLHQRQVKVQHHCRLGKRAHAPEIIANAQIIICQIGGWISIPPSSTQQMMFLLSPPLDCHDEGAPVL